jgi:hypothetical protein
MKYVLILITFSCQIALSQGGFTGFKGKIIDKTTQKPVQSAYIGIMDKGFGSCPNPNGDFVFVFPRINLDSNVTISSIGYKNYIKKANQFDSTSIIELEKPEFLQAVTALDAKKIILSAISKINDNCNKEPNFQQGFYLETVDMDKNGFVLIKEGILRIERQTGSKEKIPDKVKLLKGRRFEWTGQLSKLDGFGLGNGTIFVTRSIENTLPDILEKGNLNDYNFTVDSLMNVYNDQPIYSISFEPKSKKQKAGRTGKLYIDQYTESIIRFEYEFTPEGIKDILKSSVMSNTEIKGKAISGYNQYTILNGKWQLTDSKISFLSDFEGKLDDKYKTTARLDFYFMANETAKLGNRTTIKDNEILINTENFGKSITYDERPWGVNINYLIPTEAMKEILKKGKK